MKTNRILLCCSVLFLLLSMEPLHAQNGTQALDKVVGKFQQSNGISATFTLTVFNALNEPVEKQNGTIKLSENKFYWNTTSMTVWYDGLQQWAYVKATEEVNLTEPTTEEIATVNPYILINNYKKDFYIKTLKSKSSKESIAELTPKKKRIWDMVLPQTLKNLIQVNYEPECLLRRTKRLILMVCLILEQQSLVLILS